MCAVTQHRRLLLHGSFLHKAQLPHYCEGQAVVGFFFLFFYFFFFHDGLSENTRTLSRNLSKNTERPP